MSGQADDPEDRIMKQRQALAKLCIVGIVLVCVTVWFFGRMVGGS